MTDRKLVKQIIDEVNNDQILLDVVFRCPYTYIHIKYPVDSLEVIDGHGFAKICWPDKWDTQRGYEIALAKAARDVVSQLSSILIDDDGIATGASATAVLQYR